MSKRIVFCVDGTWRRNPNKTNVYKLYKVLVSNSVQIAHYDDGIVGADKRLTSTEAQTLGADLFQKIKGVYTKIAHSYGAGDDLFLFGFSRGAFIARSVAGMIAICGLPTKDFNDAMVDTAFRAYRDLEHRAKLLESLMSEFGMYDAKIAMLGVWDTVGSLGIPAIFGTHMLKFTFLDNSLHPNVTNAYHALAIDERRAPFPPTCWASPPVAGQTMEQVWFCGDHVDVGGGHQGDLVKSLSDITLAWMMAKSSALGLVIDQNAQANYGLPLDFGYAFTQKHDSWTPIWGPPRSREVREGSAVSNSVSIRCAYDDSYRPSNLTLVEGELSSSYRVTEILSHDIQSITQAQDVLSKIKAEELALKVYRSTYAAFEGDLVSFDQRSFKEPLIDSLGIGVYAGHLAQLISAKTTGLPLSLGLFGDWGAGKSYFMRLLHQQIDALTDRQDDVFCRKVVQIHFNAWHYLDTNLWANLVCEIFDNLFTSLNDRPDTLNAKVEALKKRLADESALAAEAKKALADAKSAREHAEKEWQKASEERKKQEQSFAAFIDDLAQVVTDSATTKDLQTLAEGFGLVRLNESYAELEARVMEARSLGGRFRTLGLTLLSPEGRYQRLMLLFVALITPVAFACIIPWLIKMKNDELSGFTRSITAVVTLIGAVATWISAQTKRGMSLITKLETAYDRVKVSREKVRTDPKAVQDELELDKQIQIEADAANALNEAQARVRIIESELRDLTPGRRLFHFLEQRSGANDYRQHLGLVSLVRRDFEQLSHLLREVKEFKDGDQAMLDRIVLYIDDLDRCTSDRVVAVLEAVHLLLAFPIFAVVVAVDPRWLRRSLIKHYPALLSDERKTKPEMATDHLEFLASPQDYLEKIFQVPFQLQPMEETGFASLVTQLLAGPSPLKSNTQSAISENLVPVFEDPAKPAMETVDALNEAELSIPPDEITEPTTAAPERLQLEEWEQEAVKECHPLFRTPRAVKRLINTYCLIRVGVEAADWNQFLGSEKNPTAEYRTPLLMLAVAAAYPGLTRRWLGGLEKNESWTPVVEPNTFLDKRGREIANDDWHRLVAALELMQADEFAPFVTAQITKWIPRVGRYTF